MAKQIEAMFFLICLIMIGMAVAVVHGNNNNIAVESAEKWFDKLGKGAKEKVTKLHFYYHDKVSGKNPTAVRVASANTPFTNSSPTSFGVISMFDDSMTVGPEPSSTELGRAQGMYGFADQNELGLAMYSNFYFTRGKYNGSTLTLLGRNAAFHETREMSIVGGTGVFRLARGIATSNTHFLNLTTFDAILEYNLVVLHY